MQVGVLVWAARQLLRPGQRGERSAGKPRECARRRVGERAALWVAAWGRESGVGCESEEETRTDSSVISLSPETCAGR